MALSNALNGKKRAACLAKLRQAPALAGSTA